MVGKPGVYDFNGDLYLVDANNNFWSKDLIYLNNFTNRVICLYDKVFIHLESITGSHYNTFILEQVCIPYKPPNDQIKKI